MKKKVFIFIGIFCFFSISAAVIENTSTRIRDTDQQIEENEGLGSLPLILGSEGSMSAFLGSPVLDLSKVNNFSILSSSTSVLTWPNGSTITPVDIYNNGGTLMTTLKLPSEFSIDLRVNKINYIGWATFGFSTSPNRTEKYFLGLGKGEWSMSLTNSIAYEDSSMNQNLTI